MEKTLFVFKSISFVVTGDKIYYDILVGLCDKNTKSGTKMIINNGFSEIYSTDNIYSVCNVFF